MSPPEPLTQSTACRLARQRIGLRELGGGVAAAKVGHALIRAQQVRAVQQQLAGAKLRRMAVIPAIGQQP